MTENTNVSGSPETVTAEQFEQSQHDGGKSKKPKTPWSKKKKIIVGSVSGVVAAILIVIMAFLIWFFTQKPTPVPFDQSNLNVDMGNDYYVGTEGTYDAELIKGKDVKTIQGAYNVSTYDDFYAKLKEGKDVVVHAKELKMTAKSEEEGWGTINLKSAIYGNGVAINAYEVVQGTLKKGGNIGISVGTDTADKKALIRDVKLFGKTMAEGDNLKTFNNYGALIDITGSEEKKAQVDIIHCVIENGHKVVHMAAANVYMEGCIVRNASDTAISIGTYANKASTFTSKNNVVADSLTGGILSYCYDGNVTEATDSEATWNTINIQGFLDIYNWKPASKLAFLPDTEGTALANAINPYLSDEVKKPEYASLAVDHNGEKYIHFGILAIATNAYGKNKCKILYDGVAIGNEVNNPIGYKSLDFPIPPFGKRFMQQSVVVGYFNKNDGSVTPSSKITDNQNLYKELREGRA